MGIFSKLFGAKKNAPKVLADAAYEGYARAADWVLLAQFDGVHSGGYELDWGDDGCLYFYIKKEDARARDFSKCGACCSVCNIYDRTRKNALRPAVYGKRPRTFCNAQPRDRVVQ